jgi:hypothetical protein
VNTLIKKFLKSERENFSSSPFEIKEIILKGFNEVLVTVEMEFYGDTIERYVSVSQKDLQNFLLKKTSKVE